MGWWSTDKRGMSVARVSSDPEMVWGDAPADAMSDALDRIIKEFISDWGRIPTMAELHAGLEFSARVALEDAMT